MKKIFISLCVAVLLFNIVSPVMAANDDYDHNALLDYEGYGQAMYETIVKETTFVTGQYTNNKEYVSKSIDEIMDYAKFWVDEGMKPAGLKEMISMGGGYLLTVGDWIKKLFNGYGDTNYPPPVVVPSTYYDFSKHVNSVTASLEESTSNFYKISLKLDVSNPFSISFYNGSNKVNLGISTGSDKSFFINANASYNREGKNLYGVGTFTGFGYGASGYSALTRYKVYEGPRVFEEDGVSEFVTKQASTFLSGSFYGGFSSRQNDVNAVLNHLIDVVNTAPTNRFTVELPLVTKPVDKQPYDQIRDYINNNDLKPVVIPEPRPYLVCPNGSKVQMSISGGTFLSADGTVMLVNKDGSSTVNSDICKLGWDKPIVKYIGDKAAIETPDGKWQDVETGEIINGDDDEEACGFFCGLGNITEFILKFFEQLLDFLIKIFIPEDTDFISTRFDNIKKIFDEKLSILSNLKDTMTGLFDDTQSPVQDYVVNLPSADKPIKLMDMSIISIGVPPFKRAFSGLIIIFTLLHVYRKIVGSGGVMEK